MRPLTSLALAALLSLSVAPMAGAAVITLDFEGLAPYPDYDQVFIAGAYDGGTSSAGMAGTDFGITFSGNAEMVCLNSTAVDCGNASRGGLGNPKSRRSGLAFDDSGPAFLTIAAGFSTGAAFNYSSLTVSGSVGIYDGPDGTGTLLASIPFIPNAGSCDAYNGASFCPFLPAGVLFTGTARSLLFGGRGLVSFDDVTLGSNIPGGTGADMAPVPLPAALPLAAGALGGLALLRRRRRRARR